MTSHYWIAIAIGIVVYHWLRSDTTEEKPAHEGGAILFPVRSRQRRFWLFSVIGSGVLLILAFTVISDSVVTWFALAMLFFGLVSRPRDIEISERNISKVWVAGLFRTSIPWEDVTHAIDYTSERTVRVIVGDRPSVVHTRLHAARGEFLLELQKHTRVLSSARAGLHA
ncbi:MAG TPA: hypothetical protein DCY80_03465 [Solibacterales bacterium]|nr:hypothetical protein [Bryobacterales bacterium]